MRRRNLYPSRRGPMCGRSVRHGRERRRYPVSRRRGGFTLVELLVTIGIFLLVTAMTLAMLNVSADRDRIRGAARHVQSRLEGARDRAIYAGEPRGVRFLIDPNGPVDSSGNRIAVTSSVYIGAPGMYSIGEINTLGWNPTEPKVTGDYIQPANSMLSFICTANGTTGSVEPTWPTTVGAIVPDGTATWQAVYPVLQGSGTNWSTLASRGLLVAGARIEVPAGGGNWYTISVLDAATDKLSLTKMWPGAPPSMPCAYRLELQPSPLPGQEPALLPRNVVIDLPCSRLPRSWGGAANWQTGNLDIMFSPQGVMTGPDASGGLVHFVLRDLDTVLADLNNPGWGFGEDDGEHTGNELIVTVTPSTGNIASHPVNAVPIGQTTDPFLYAETGEVAP